MDKALEYLDPLQEGIGALFMVAPRLRQVRGGVMRGEDGTVGWYATVVWDGRQGAVVRDVLADTLPELVQRVDRILAELAYL